MRRTGFFILVVFMVLATISCDKKEDPILEEETIFEDGNYSAEEGEYTDYWKGFLNIEIVDDKIVTAEFDYFNAAGDFKSETTLQTYPMAYHPSEWIPLLEAKLRALDLTANVDVDAQSGATNSSNDLNELLDAILIAAKAGDTAKQIVN
jgi:major membrane immunogen (membrane-anchored lipoprotein)